MIRSSFDRDWYVLKDGASPDTLVGPVTVPYDAMLFEDRDPNTRNVGNTGYYPGGVYRYTKTFDAPEAWRERAVVLEFEGVYHRSEVFVNGELAGGRPSGYALFHVELDEFLEYGAENTVEVVAHNDDEPNGRWYTGSGIYRPVHLLVGERVRIAPTGLRISTAALTGGTATVDIQTTLINGEAIDQVLDVVTEIRDPRRFVVATTRTELTVPAGETVTARQQVEIADAALWSPGTPQLHTASTRIEDGDATFDSAEEEFGIRVVTADARHGLRINGTPVKLRGAAIHHDNGVIGAHTLDAADDRRIRILKESGFNAIRSAHNAASRSLLRACDRHGVLVMDELTDAWFRPKVLNDYSLDFVDWWERDLEALVANGYNHPSVIMYSIGNEIAETATPRGIEMNKRIADRTRELDPSRLVTNGINGFLNLISPQDEEKLAAKAAAARETGENPNKNLIGILNLIIGILDRMLDRIVRLKAVDKRTRDAFAALDVAGYNYMVGRYEIDAKLHPHRVIVGSETRAAHTVKIWKRIEHLNHVIGDFAWTGWDYIGEAGLASKQYGTTKRSIYHPYPALLAGEPVIDITGFRQSQSYLNEIAWHLATGPHIAVEPVNHSGEKVVKTGWRATNSIDSWSWEGCEGREATVEVYADAARIELQLNGVTVATAKAGKDGDYLTKFTLPYQPGELTAVAYDSRRTEIGRRTLKSAGPGLRFQVRPESTELIADGHDLAYLPIELTDDDGIVRPLADRAVTVTVEGAAALLGFGTGEVITTEGFASPTHRTFNGRALAVLRAGHEPGNVTVTVTAEGVEPQQVTLRVGALAVDPSIDEPHSARTAVPFPRPDNNPPLTTHPIGEESCLMNEGVPLMSEMKPLAEEQGLSVLPSEEFNPETATYKTPPPTKTPRGYTFTFALSSFGIYVALLAPVYGGLSVKIQEMAGIDAAPALLGLLTGAGALFSTVVQPVAGRLSDRSTSRFGMRRPFMLIGVLVAALFLVLSGLAPNYPLLLIFWCGVQLGANFALAAHHTTLADQVPEPKRGGVSGIIGAVTPAAILGGALFLTVLPTTFLRFTVPAIFGLVAMLIFVLFLKDKVRTNKPTTKMNLKLIFTSYVFHPRRYPDFGWAWLSKALVLLAFGATSTYITLFLGAVYGMEIEEQLQFNALAQVASIGTLVVFSVLGGYLSDKVGRRKPFVLVAGVVLGFGVILIALSPLFGDAGLTVLLIAQAVIGMGAGTFFAVDQALCISVLPNQDEMAKDLGVLNLAGTLPGVLAPLLAGVIFIPLGNALFGGGYTLWFSLAGIIGIIGGLLVLKIKGVK